MKRKILIVCLLLATMILCACDIIEYHPQELDTDPSSITDSIPKTETNTDLDNSVNSCEQTTNDDNEPINNENVNSQNSVIRQFVAVGFTDTEAEDLKNKFDTMGLTEIREIQPTIGNGIDGLQSFVAKVFDTDALTLVFTVENRKLCFVSLDGFKTEKVDGLYIDFWGDLKFKVIDSKESVVFYDIWDESGEIIEGATGYKAVYDYGENRIYAYQEQN